MLPSAGLRTGVLPEEIRKLRHFRRVGRRRQHSRWSTGALVGAVAAILAGFTVFARTSTHSVPVTKALRKMVFHQVSETVGVPMAPSAIWQVEENSASTLYSNGLEVRREFATNSRQRAYHTFSTVNLVRSAEEFTAPAGIVYHTTESLLLPLKPAEARKLVRTREDLLQHVRNDKLYNFVIDRFGQVFRVVPEDEVALHAGHSIWADNERVYDGLNESFIGVAFETRTGDFAEPAQIRAARLLTEYLRGRYGIAESNCVTHAQVSVNRENMRIGYHTDWATDFPFEQLGLHQGYLTALPSIALFGFTYDREFLDAIGGEPWPGVTTAEKSIEREASARGENTQAYRRQLQDRYRRIRAMAKAG